MIKPDRLKAAMDRKGFSQSELARRTELSSSMIGKLARGGARETAHIYDIARALGVSPEYLSGDCDSIDVASEAHLEFKGFPPLSVIDLAADQGLIPIRQLDLSFGMGATYIDNPVDEEIRLFPEVWLRQFTNAPAEFIYFAQGAGDSMLPTLHPNDTLIIDASNTRMTMADQIWACNFAGLGMVKRLRPTPDGGVKIMSDNPNVGEEVAYDGELSLFGRVVAVVRKI